MIKQKNQLAIILWTLGLYAISTVFLFIFPHPITAGLFALFTTTLPFILIFLLAFSLGLSKLTKKIGWMKLLCIVIPFVYLLFAYQWAGDKINEIFGIDPSSFLVTTSFLTVTYGPILLYSSSVWHKTYAIAVVYIPLVILLIVTFLFIPDVWKRLNKKYFIITLLILVFIPIFMGLNSFFVWRFNSFVEYFALWADFNNKHRCLNLSSEGVSKVIFLGGDKVLAYYPYKTGPDRYAIRECIYSIKP